MALKAISAKVTTDEFKTVERLATDSGLTVSAWVYCAIQEKAKKSGVKLPNKRTWKRKETL